MRIKWSVDVQQFLLDGIFWRWLLENAAHTNLMSRLSILYVAPYWPDKATSAGEWRVLQIARALGEIGGVQVAVVYAEGHDGARLEKKDPAFNVIRRLPVENRAPAGARQKLKWILNPRAVYPHGQGVDRPAMEDLRGLTEKFEIIWFCKLRTANMFPQWAWPRSVADIDDLPSTYARSVCKSERQFPKRVIAASQVLVWRRREKLLDERFTVLGVCSEGISAISRRSG